MSLAIQHYQGIRDAFRQIYRTEGLRGYYRGLSAALFLTTPETALKFGLYQAFNSIWQNNFVIISSKGSEDKQIGVGILQSSINSFMAGLISKFIIYPFDLAKKRLQIRGFEEARLSFGQVSRTTLFISRSTINLIYPLHSIARLSPIVASWIA